MFGFFLTMLVGEESSCGPASKQGLRRVPIGKGDGISFRPMDSHLFQINDFFIHHILAYCTISTFPAWLHVFLYCVELEVIDCMLVLGIFMASVHSA